MATPKEIDTYLCRNKHLCLKLSLNRIMVTLEPHKCYFIVTLHDGYTIRNQTLFNNWDEAIDMFKSYSKQAFELELKDKL